MDGSALVLRGLLVRRQGDRELLAAALGDDSVAFAEIYRRFNTRIHGFCLARLGDAEAAADVTQEVFIRVLRSEAADIENPAAWLYTIARNAVVDAQRAAGRRPVPSEIDENAATVNGLTPAGAHELVESDEDIDSVLLAMRTIAPRYRTAIVMRDIKYLTSAEAAEQLHTSTGALDTLLHRARRALSREHARLSSLPAACLRATALVHAPDAGQVSEAERQALEVHLLGCEHCRGERSQVGRRRALQALLPFLFPVERGADAISRIALLGAHPIARVAAVGLAMAVAIAPVHMAIRPIDAARSTVRIPAGLSRSRSAASFAGDLAARLGAHAAYGMAASSPGTGAHGSAAVRMRAAGQARGGPARRPGSMTGAPMGATAGTSTHSGTGTGGPGSMPAHSEPAHGAAMGGMSGSGSSWPAFAHR